MAHENALVHGGGEPEKERPRDARRGHLEIGNQHIDAVSHQKSATHQEKQSQAGQVRDEDGHRDARGLDDPDDGQHHEDRK